jgi:TfoX/Sxy family transcriptional regulator of competence genes
MEDRLMSMPRADAAVREYFDAVLPDDPRILVRPMFGNLAGFVNGNMFTGVFGDTIFVRLDEGGRTELLAIPGAEPFEPMAGRPMREYVVLPEAWRQEPERTRTWLARALEWAGELPPKEPKPRKKK